MKVEVKTLLTVLTGGCPIFTGEYKPGDFDELLEKSVKLTRQLPYVEFQGKTKEELRKINADAKANEIYRRLPKLKNMSETIAVSSTALRELAKNNNYSDGQYADICKILEARATALLGKDYVNLKFEDEAQA